MDNNSGAGVEFGFGKTKTDTIKEEPKVESPVEETVIETVAAPKIEENLEEEYTDERSVTVALVRNYSLYRRSNDKTLPKKKDYIGSSISSSRVLAANKEEVEAYFPNLVGLSPNDKDFVLRVKQYLNNIKIPVDELGKKFDNSFHYHHKSDYLAIKREEEVIEASYNKANRQNLKELKDALKEKINRLNVLESKKHKFGYPTNVEDYLMYRHCLLYNDIAKDTALINNDPNVRFYFKDDAKEADKLRKYRLEVNKAKANYVACLADDELFNAVYIAYCATNGMPVIASMAEPKLDKEIKLDRFSNDEPIKFNAIFNNKDIKLEATIETLIARGELVRYQYNQNILSAEGEFIGANVKEAVVWFKDPKNASAVNAYYNRLKNI